MDDSSFVPSGLLSKYYGGDFDVSCFHPLKGFVLGVNLQTRKKIMKVTSYSVPAVYQMDPDGPWYCAPDLERPPGVFRFETKSMDIPCGKCVGCRLEYSRQWANRCMLELQYHDSAYFVTLTYNDFAVPKSYYPDPETGEAQQSLTLSKRDWQLFMKRLRFQHPDDHIRFFMCGEYGPNTFRPHYHAIIFGLHLDDLKPWSRSNLGYQYYLSESLSKAWSSSVTCKDLFGESFESPKGELGHVLVGDVTWETCAYTARYIMKKLKGPESQFYSDFGLEPPFVLMSRRPGIGRQYYDDHPDMYDYDYINLRTEKGGRKIRPPHYYDKIFDVDQPERMAEIKLTRQRMAEAVKRLKLSKTSLSYLDYLITEEDVLQAKLSSLQRKEF